VGKRAQVKRARKAAERALRRPKPAPQPVRPAPSLVRPIVTGVIASDRSKAERERFEREQIAAAQQCEIGLAAQIPYQTASSGGLRPGASLSHESLATESNRDSQQHCKPHGIHVTVLPVRGWHLLARIRAWFRR
jgi:hypothetical protein